MSASNTPSNPHHLSSPSSRTRARSMSTSDAVDFLAANAGEEEEGELMVLFPSPSVGHFSGLQTVNSGEEVDDALPTRMPPSAERANLLMLSATEAHPLIHLQTEHPVFAAPEFPFDHFEHDDAATSSSGPPSLSSRSVVSRNNSSTLSSSDHLSANDGAAPSSFTHSKRQRSHRRRLQLQQPQQRSSSVAAVQSSSTVTASSTSSRGRSAEATGGSPSLRASLDAGMAAMRKWIRSHRQQANSNQSSSASASRGNASPRTRGGEEDGPDDGNGNDDDDDDLFPTIFEMDDPTEHCQQEPQSPWPAHRSNLQRQRTRSEPDSAGVQEYFLLSSVRRRRRRASTADERSDDTSRHQHHYGSSSAGNNGGATIHHPSHHSSLATPPRPRSLFLQTHPRGSGSGERLSSSAAAALSWPATAATTDGGGSLSEPHRRQLSLDAQQMLSLLTPSPTVTTGTPNSSDPFARNDDILFPSGANDDSPSGGDVATAANRSLLPALETAAAAPPPQASGSTELHPSLQQQQSQSRMSSSRIDGSSDHHDAAAIPQQPRDQGFSAEDIREREARLRWIRINRRFQVVITAVALVFSVVLFAILLCWVVLTSTYVVSLDKPCDVNLKAYFWLVSLQLVLDVFRSDILRFIFRWDSESSDRIPCRVIAYNMVYLLYALLVLRLGILSVYVGNPSCSSTAPELFKASTAFVSLSLTAWAIILFGYVVPLFVVAGLLTYNGYNPTDGSMDGRLPMGAGPTPVFPSAYSMSGAPPSCIEQMERVRVEDVRGQECCICMEPFDKDDVVVRTTCHHCFHKLCCREWLRQARTCPVCRADIPSTLPTLDGVGGSDPAQQSAASSSAGGSGGDGPSRIPLGPTGRPVRGLFLRMFRHRGGGSNGDRGNPSPSPPPPSSSSGNSVGMVAIRSGGVEDLELGLSSSAAVAALSPRSRYATSSSS